MEPDAGAPPLHVVRLGEIAYAAALAQQEALHAEVARGHAPDTLLLLEHPPVVTAGRNTKPGHLRCSPADLAARGIAYHDVGRGGDVTYHGPGQLVGYPIVRLRQGEQDLRAYVTRLEAALIATAADFGVRAARVPGLRGIWVGNDKLAAIGVRVVRWTTLHGFALNVSVAPSAFDCIVPCGLVGRGVTSLAVLCGAAPAAAAVAAAAAAHLAQALGRVAVDSALPGPHLGTRHGAAAVAAGQGDRP